MPAPPGRAAARGQSTGSDRQRGDLRQARTGRACCTAAPPLVRCTSSPGRPGRAQAVASAVDRPERQLAERRGGGARRRPSRRTSATSGRTLVSIPTASRIKPDTFG